MAACAAVACCAMPLSVAAASSTPDDPAFTRHQQWGLAQAGFPDAWCRSTGAGALVVVLDTGVDAAHPDLAGKLVGQARVQNGVISTGPGSAADDSGHGTHVAGIAVADTGNGVGVAGAAPDARLYAIKVLFPVAAGRPEQGSAADLVQAIDFAADNVAPSWPGPVVLNVSIGAADPDGSDQLAGTADVSAALEHAYARGLGVAVAAGNVGTAPVADAAVQQGAALSVGALDQNGALAAYSPTSGVSVFAAGGSANAAGQYTSTGILSTWPHSSAGDYAWMAGTSMAAPHVAAALALLMSTGLSNADAYGRLLQSVDAQKRLHVDVALDSTTPCGPSVAAAPVHAAASPLRQRPAVPASRVPVRAATPAPVRVTPAPATAAPHPAVAVMGDATVAPSLQATSSRATLAGRAAMGVGAAVLLWMMLPRQLLLRRARS